MTTREAIVKAKSVGLDLVEIAPKADPPVCRIVDYGKYKYEQSKLKKTSKSKGPVKMKEVKFRVRTDPHDYNIKLSHAEDFLEAGNKVRIQLQFRGRENAHHNVGFEVMQRIKADLLTMGHVDMDPKLAGRQITMMLSPLPEHARQRRFKLSHGKLIEVDDYEDDEVVENAESPEEGDSDNSKEEETTS
jgi:translation initiation factor IF-3